VFTPTSLTRRRFLAAAGGAVDLAVASATSGGRVRAETQRLPNVIYTPPGTEQWAGDLTIPPAPHRDTLIVLIHGGGGTMGDKRSMTKWAERYALAGYPTFNINYYLFDETTPAPIYPHPERNVKAAVQYVRRNAAQFAVDPERILAHGGSAGARLSAELHVTGNDPYFADPLLWPDTPDHTNGLIGFYGPYDSGQTSATQYYGGPRNSPDPAVRDRSARANSTARAATARGPATLSQGDSDDLVPVSAAINFADALIAAGKDATLTIVPGAEHGFDHDGLSQLSPEGERAAQSIVAWLDSRFPWPRTVLTLPTTRIPAPLLIGGGILPLPIQRASAPPPATDAGTPTPIAMPMPAPRPR